jgi:hypothetical protein
MQPRCDDEVKKGRKLCYQHQRVFDNKRYELEHNKKDGSKDKMLAWVAAMKDPVFMVKQIEASCVERASVGRWKNQQFLTNAQWEEEAGFRINDVSGQQLHPYEKEQWILKKIAKYGWTRSRADGRWCEMLVENWEQDRKGEDGDTRLWLPKDFKQKDKGNFQNMGVKERSDVLKDHTQEELDALRRHVHDKAPTMSHHADFFKGKSGVRLSDDQAPRREQRADAATVADKGSANDDSDEEPSKDTDSIPTDEPAFKKLKGNIVKLRTTASEGMEKAVDKNIDNINMYGGQLCLALQAAHSAPRPTEHTDIKARTVYIKDARNHLALLRSWIGCAVGAGGDVPTPGTPATSLGNAVVNAPTPGTPATSPDAGAVETAADPASVQPTSVAASPTPSPAIPKPTIADKAVLAFDAELRAIAANSLITWVDIDKSMVASGAAADNASSLFKSYAASLGIDAFTSETLKRKEYCPFSEHLVFVESIIDSNPDHNMLAVMKLAWSKMIAAAASFMKGCKDSATSLRSHVAALEKEKIKTAEKQKAMVEAEALKKEKIEQKQRANAIKEQAKASTSLPAIFDYLRQLSQKPDKGNLQPMQSKARADLNKDDFLKPFIVTSGDSIATWSNNGQMQGVVAKWATQYKKDEDFITKKTKSAPFELGAGLEQTEAMFADILEPVKDIVMNLAKISKGWQSTSWAFGHHLDFHCSACAPNSSAIFRYQSMGDTTYFAFDLANVNTSTLDSMSKFKHALAQVGLQTHADLNPLLQRDLNIHFGTISKGQVVYIPAGYFIIEHVAKGPLCFGARKSFFINLPSHKDSYQKAKTMFEADGRAIERMDQILSEFAA